MGPCYELEVFWNQWIRGYCAPESGLWQQVKQRWMNPQPGKKDYCEKSYNQETFWLSESGENTIHFLKKISPLHCWQLDAVLVVGSVLVTCKGHILLITIPLCPGGITWWKFGEQVKAIQHKWSSTLHASLEYKCASTIRHWYPKRYEIEMVI